ncbi:MAG: hypothetical protein M3M88_05505 [Thermoproteota archaeon]|nr:hypothetical protein [Thermoproteota archaeon]
MVILSAIRGASGNYRQLVKLQSAMGKRQWHGFMLVRKKTIDKYTISLLDIIIKINK